MGGGLVHHSHQVSCVIRLLEGLVHHSHQVSCVIRLLKGLVHHSHHVCCGIRLLVVPNLLIWLILMDGHLGLVLWNTRRKHFSTLSCTAKLELKKTHRIVV